MSLDELTRVESSLHKLSREAVVELLITYRMDRKEAESLYDVIYKLAFGAGRLAERKLMMPRRQSNGRD
jgi:hypothetical protein